MKSLGCFAYDDIFYHVIHRPINVLPDDRKQIATKFLLYTKRNPNEPELLIADDSNLNESFFDAASKSKVIVHGFMDSLDIGKWIGIMKDEFLKHSDYNVIVVDWSHGSRPPYTRATANTRVVGAELAHLIKALHNSTGVRPESFHVVGHSLGAQIAGYAGERLDKLGRITGLDPAGPYFFHMPPQVRLDPSDAAFVDVIHSDASLPFHLFTNLGIFNEKGFGIDQLVGSRRLLPEQRQQAARLPPTAPREPGPGRDARERATTGGLRPPAIRGLLHGHHQHQTLPPGRNCVPDVGRLCGRALRRLRVRKRTMRRHGFPRGPNAETSEERRTRQAFPQDESGTAILPFSVPDYRQDNQVRATVGSFR
ncbi:alpha/beta hydrolase, putative [Ixodes scapularis]|uniref:Alpha/beta hydrolase, putative n=1 Tax=Ixodes scapularis TaxID=6945 RepID=B7PF84_IXOSC|nr:alpha/beta hydrolase, putative [Ixodes scapularis]|eukprot:XP_002433856.1 alpha/beta hydrolase, putative [Ixodes scapularis]